MVINRFMLQFIFGNPFQSTDLSVIFVLGKLSTSSIEERRLTPNYFVMLVLMITGIPFKVRIHHDIRNAYQFPSSALIISSISPNSLSNLKVSFASSTLIF